MREKTKLMDRDAMRRAITRISYEILEKNKGADKLVLAGVVRRGRFIAERISRQIENVEGVKVPCLALNTAAYRDDAPADVKQAREKNCDPAFIEGKTVIVVDDVLHTGRTVRAAMEALMDCGRPAAIRLAVLIDRGHRELPIRPDYVGKNVPTSPAEKVRVFVSEQDDEDLVSIWE